MSNQDGVPQGPNGGGGASVPTGPLAGIRVIDLTSVVLGPYCSQILGDMGADVIKVETAEGDTTRLIGPSRTPKMGSYFANVNRNKRSVVLDLKTPAGNAAMLRLVETADVFVHNMRIGAAERLGLDYATLSTVNPSIIYGCSTGFRKGSSMQDYPAYDDLVQGVSGLASLNAGPGEAPRYMPTVLVDKLTGATLASMIGMALFHRERTGEGQELHVPMMETIVSFMLIEHLWSGTLGEPDQGLGYPRLMTPHRRPYYTLDGHISVMAHTDAQWAKLLGAIERPDLAQDARFATVAARAVHVDALYAILSDGLGKRSTEDWLALLRLADIPCGRINTLGSLFTDPYLLETGFFAAKEHPVEGKVVVPAIPAWFSRSPPNVHRLWPQLGQHTREVLAEIGYSDPDIDRMTA